MKYDVEYCMHMPNMHWCNGALMWTNDITYLHPVPFLPLMKLLSSEGKCMNAVFGLVKRLSNDMTWVLAAVPGGQDPHQFPLV